MKRRSHELAARRELLLARSARLRAELAGDAAALGVRLHLADELVASARSGIAHVALIGGALLLVFGRGRRLLGLATRVAVLWPFIRPLLPHLRRLWRSR